MGPILSGQRSFAQSRGHCIRQLICSPDENLGSVGAQALVYTGPREKGDTNWLGTCVGLRCRLARVSHFWLEAGKLDWNLSVTVLSLVSGERDMFGLETGC